MKKPNRIFKIQDIVTGLYVNPNVWSKLTKVGKTWSSLSSLKSHLSHAKYTFGSVRIIELVYNEVDVTQEFIE